MLSSLWLNGFLGKIKHPGITGELYEILTSYLADRKARTCVEGHISEIMNVYARLGPILFILYINDIATQLDLDSTHHSFSLMTQLYWRLETTPLKQWND